MEKEVKKQGVFKRIKHRMARGLVMTVLLYAVFLLILIGSNRTNVNADVLILWMLVPAAYLAITAAILAEISWSAGAHFARKKKSEEKVQEMAQEAAQETLSGNEVLTQEGG